MPLANVQTGTGDTPQAWYYGLPPITRLYGTVCVLTTLCTMLGLVKPMLLYMHWPLVIGKVQLWRLLGTFIYLGPPSFAFLLRILWIIQYGVPLEKITFQFSTADFVYMMLFGMASLLAASAAVPMGFLGPSLIFMLTYVWSRNFPTTNVSLMGLVNLQAFYLPFALMALSVLMGGDWISDAMGIVVGHLYYFLKTLHPAAGGGQYLETPNLVKRWLLRAGIQDAHMSAREARMAHPSDPRFRAFAGQGRRLNG